MTKELRWCGSAQADLAAMPDGVRRQFGRKLQYLCAGELISGAKSWRGCGPNGVEYASGGYRLIVTTEFENVVCALHVFKKDGPRGPKTRKKNVDTAVRRYEAICAEYAARSQKQ